MQYCKLPRDLIVPMISPFNSDHSIDTKAAVRIVDHLLEAEAAGIFLLGTTGEGRAMTVSQKEVLVENVSGRVGSKAHLYVGISDNDTRAAVQAGQRYSDMGADFVVAHPPIGSNSTPDNVADYFLGLADQLPLPLVLYNIPKIAGVSIDVDTVIRLADHPNIVGLKDSEGDQVRLAQLLKEVAPRPKFAILVGNAPLSSFGLRHGADGLVPSTANLIPRMYHSMIVAAREGDWDAVERLQQTTDQVSRHYQNGRQLTESLAELKRMMNEGGLCGPVVVLPQKQSVGGYS